MSGRKILIVTNRVPYPYKDGGNIAMHAMIEGYRTAGWQVYLLSMNTTRHHVSEKKLADLYKDLYAFDWIEIDNRVRAAGVIKNYLFSKEPEHVGRFFHQSFQAKLVEVCASFQPDVVQLESIFLSSYLPAIKENTQAITVLRMHNVEYQIWRGLAKQLRNRIKQLYMENLAKRLRTYERSCWKEYDLLLPITEEDAAQVNRLENVSHMIVAPFSIDTAKIPQPASKERWVGYHIGAMDWIPNREAVQWFINKAWPAVHKAAPQFEFYFAGRNMPEDFKKLHAPGVHCMDEVLSAEDFIADKKILIVPIWSGGGIRVKILEAMAASKVVITTAAGIRGIEAKAGIHYLLVQKPADFARAIKWCLDNKGAAEKMAAMARDLINETYEQGKVAQAIIDELGILIHARQS